MEPPAESPPKASIPREERVPATSPARLLAKSLTDAATRGEWVREYRGGGYSFATEYRNEQRDIRVTTGRTLGIGLCPGRDWLSTPFTLSETEEKVARSALDAFNKHLKDEAERAALERLVASGIEVAKPARREASRPKAKARPAKQGTPK